MCSWVRRAARRSIRSVHTSAEHNMGCVCVAKAYVPGIVLRQAQLHAGAVSLSRVCVYIAACAARLTLRTGDFWIKENDVR